jgi:hypothetical protein
MGAGLLAVKSGFILFIKNYQFPLQINTLERERDTSRRRRVIQGLTSQVGRLQVQGRDTSRRCHLTGARHTTSLPPTRVHCPLCGYPSASFYLRRFNPFLFRRLGFFSFSITVFVTAHTLTHLRPGPSGVTGFMGSLLDLMRQTLGC